jgi:hypothetical protein
MLQDHVLQHPQGIIVYKDRGCYPQVLITTGSAPGICLTASTSLEEGARVFGVDVSPSPMSLTERPLFYLSMRLHRQSNGTDSAYLPPYICGDR